MSQSYCTITAIDLNTPLKNT